MQEKFRPFIHDAQDSQEALGYEDPKAQYCHCEIEVGKPWSPDQHVVSAKGSGKGMESTKPLGS